MKIIHATPMGTIMTENEIAEFLESSITNLQLATIDKKAEPVIQPVWFYADSKAERIYVNTYRDSHKARNLRNRSVAYFSVDEDTFPYRCVKGKAKVTFSEQVETNLAIAGKIMSKYLGSTDHPTAVEILNSVRSGQSLLIQLAPIYYSTWRFD
jgi:nitroimidazol reductase NimA-like FMN-containing flavoprotein (pyridoxamine 5'-phosphate oxidase superfamily)